MITRPRTTLNNNKLVRGGGTRARPYGPNGRPNLILGNNNPNYPDIDAGPAAGLQYPPGGTGSIERDVVVKDAYRQDTSVVIQWDSETANILGFRVVYRLFGDNSFQPGPPLDPSEREFKIKNVPSQVRQILSSNFRLIVVVIKTHHYGNRKAWWCASYHLKRVTLLPRPCHSRSVAKSVPNRPEC